MANERSNVEVSVNGTQAEDKLKDLYNSAKKFKLELEKAWKTGDPKSIKKAENDFKNVTKEVNKLQKQLFDVDKVLKNLGGSSIKDLKKAQRELNSELNSGAVKRNSKDWDVLTSKLRRVDSEIKKVNMEMRSSQSLVSRMANGFQKYWSMLVTMGAGLVGAIMSMRKAVDVANDYGESLANLSALTGLVGKELDWLSERAKAFSGSVTKEGIRITTAAKDIVDGMTIMGSARPELLKDKEALALVTEQALILAAASKIEMVPAIDAVAASMNQFQLPASEANRIINALAAGSLAGSAEVGNLTESFSKVGTVAADSNMTMEQTVGVLETLAARQLKGAEAGTQLRSSLISMKAAGIGYTSGVFNIRDAIIELKARIDSKATALEKDNVLIDIFGKRNITVGTILSKNIGVFDQYTKAVTGTNVATQQAITNTTHNKARLEASRAELNKNVIMLGEKLAPALTFSTSSFSYMIKAIVLSIKFYKEHRSTILTLITTITAYVVIMKIANSWDKIQIAYTAVKTLATTAYGFAVDVLSGKITFAIIKQKAWNLVQKLNPIGAIVTLLLAAGAALYLYSKRLTDAEISQKQLNEVEKQALENTAKQKIELESLMKIAKDETKSKQDRLDAIKNLNRISPEYLGNLTLETINSKEATIATEEYTAAIEKQAKAQAAKEKLIEIEKQLIDLTADGTGAELKWYQLGWNAIKSLGNASKIVLNNTLSAIDNIDGKTKELLLKKAVLMGLITEDPSNVIISTPSGGDEDPVGDAETEYADLLKLLEGSNADKLNVIRQSYLDQQLSKEQFDYQMLLQELTFLEAKKVLQNGYNEDTIDTESQILLKKIALFDDELARIKKAEDGKTAAKKKGDDERAANDKKAKDEYIRGIQERMAANISIMNTASGAIENFAAGNENALQEGAKAMLGLMLDYLKAQTEMAIAGATIQSLASPESILTFGVAGLAKAALIVGLIEAAFAGVKGLLSRAFTKKPKTESVTQYASGRYPVLGATDNKLYNADYIGKPKTGIINKASLISENGSEMIIDGPTTRNLVFNYPDIVRGIKNLSQNMDPAFHNNADPVGNNQSNATDPLLIKVLLRLNDQLEKPLKVDKISFPMHDFRKASVNYDKIEKLVSTKN